MATDFGIHSQSDSASIHRFHLAGNNEQQPHEAAIEARIQQLGDQIQNLHSDSRLVWLNTGPHVYNADFDLSVKVEAVRWMLRIARHMQNSAREVMLLRIQNSLHKLEKALATAQWSSAT
jgi:hypothetical protein